VAELLVDVLESDGHRRQALALPEIQQRLGGGQEGPAGEEEIVRLVRGPLEWRPVDHADHRALEERRGQVAPARLHGEAETRRGHGRAPPPARSARGVDENARRRQSLHRRLARRGEASLQRSSRRDELARVAHREPIQEDEGVAPPGISHILDLERVRPVADHSRLELDLQALRLLAVPGGLSHERPVHPDANVMVDHSREVAPSLQGNRDVGRTTRHDVIGGEGVAPLPGRDDHVPQPEIRRVQEARLVVDVLFPPHRLAVLGNDRGSPTTRET
jgi:hypothetical protein